MNLNKIKTKNIFDYLIRKLRDRGFSVRVDKAQPEFNYGRTAYVFGKAKVAVMIYEGEGWYKRENQSVFIENKKCFNKWSQAPIKLPLPTTHQQLNYLFGMINFLKSKEGYLSSKKFFWQEGYPEGMEND